MEQSFFSPLKNQLFNTTLALYKVSDRMSEHEPLRVHLRERAVGILALTQDVFSGKNFSSEIHHIVRQEFDALIALLEFGRFYSVLNPKNFSVLIDAYTSLWIGIDEAMGRYAQGGDDSLQKLLATLNDPLTSASKEISSATPSFSETPSGVSAAKKSPLPPSIKPTQALPKVTRSWENGTGNARQLERQKKIMDIITSRASSDFQLKDLLAAFPDLNEKTVRNDLKEMCEKGILSREGAGRSSMYRLIRNSEHTVSESEESNQSEFPNY